MAAARFSASLAIALALSLASSTLSGQEVACDPGDVEVRRLNFEGNQHFDDDELATLINTTATNLPARSPALRWWLGHLFGRRRCLDRQDFPLDRLRLIVFYRNKGFDRATVDTLVQPVGRNAASVTFRIQEGAPIRIDTLLVRGLDAVPGARTHIDALRLRPGGLFDKYAIDTAQAELAARLRNDGYPRAQVVRSLRTDPARRAGTVELQVMPGPRARVGEVVVSVEPRDSSTPRRTSPRTVRSIFGVDSGAVYAESRLVAGQRRLYETQAYTAIRVELDSASLQEGDSLQRILVRVTEGDMHVATLGAGWGTLDCFRLQGGYSQYNFLGGGRRLELSGRLSRIGVGHPFRLDVGPFSSEQVCTTNSRPSRDLYGDLANYYIGATLRQPLLFGFRSLPSLTVYREVRSEFNAFRRTTPIGAIATFSSSRRPRLPLTMSYRVEAGRTTASPAFFCAVSQICAPEDRLNAERLQRLAVLSLGLSRIGTDNPVNPTRGTLLRLDARHASPIVGSEPSLQFNTLVAEASWYQRIGGGILATRLRAGSVFGTRLRTAFTDRGSFVPPQERLYAGGPNSVRGFKQNELGPKAYLSVAVPVDSITTTGDTLVQMAPGTGARVVPVGGNSLVIGNFEFRMRSPFFPELLQFAAFTDVGEVWNRGAGDDVNFRFIRLNWTPGVGARALTAFGAVRIDVAYNGYPSRRGPAYFDQGFRGAGEGGQLFCVSPGNTLRVTGTGLARRQEAGPCPGSFSTDVSSNFFRRLVPSISIGQAF